MREFDDERMRTLLKQAVPPTASAAPQHDLWPAMQRRMQARPAFPPWFDWALAGCLMAFVLLFPSAIPILLYCL